MDYSKKPQKSYEPMPQTTHSPLEISIIMAAVEADGACAGLREDLFEVLQEGNRIVFADPQTPWRDPSFMAEMLAFEGHQLSPISENGDDEEVEVEDLDLIRCRYLLARAAVRVALSPIAESEEEEGYFGNTLADYTVREADDLRRPSVIDAEDQIVETGFYPQHRSASRELDLPSRLTVVNSDSRTPEVPRPRPARFVGLKLVLDFHSHN